MTLDSSALATWIGRSETVTDTIGSAPAIGLAATFDHPPRPFADGTPLPPLWHWLHLLPAYRQSEIGADGHPTRGGFLPPVPLPRRMWAGSQFEFASPVRVGDRVARTSTIADVTRKDGRSGTLVFVRVRHELRCNDAPLPALIEHQDIVYRDAPAPGDPAPPPAAAPGDAVWQRTLVPDEVMLFRFSALTFNGHRIHYDRPYVTGVEGYPGLVVHGPMIATLLLDLLHRERPDVALADFRFRAVRPAFDGRPLTFNGRPSDDGRSVRLWTQDHEGWLTMEATATLR